MRIRNFLAVFLTAISFQVSAAVNDCIWGSWGVVSCPSLTYGVTDPGVPCAGTDFQISLLVTNVPGSKQRSDNCGNTETAAITYSYSVLTTVLFTDENGSQNLPGGSGGSVTNAAAGAYTFTWNITATSSDPLCAGANYQMSATVNVNCCASDADSGGCSSCASAVPKLGGSSTSLDSLNVRMNLGRGLYGVRPAGMLFVHETVPSTELSTPLRLKFGGLTNGVEIILSGDGALRQVKTSEGLADIVTDSALQYRVSFYSASNAGAKSGGVYVPTGTALAVCTILNPDSNGAINRLWFYRTEPGSGTTNVSKFAWTDATQEWELITGGDLASSGGLRHERLQTTLGGGYSKTETRSVLDQDLNLVSKKVTRYQVVNGTDRVVSEVLDPDSAGLTTATSYYADGRVQQVARWDGSWYYCVYDAAGRPSRRYAAFLNQGSTTNAAQCRVTEYAYDPITAAGDDGSVDSTNAPRLVISKLLGQEVGRSYAVVLSGEYRDIRCQTPGAAWNASDNLVTITKTNTSGAFANLPQSAQYPDGTMALYSYATNATGTTMTNTVDKGQPSGTSTVTNGTRTVTVAGTAGETISRTATDIASGLVIEQASYSGFDGFHRPGRVDYLDGTYETTTYACCGIDTQTDRQGVQTSYTYDALQRIYITTRDGLSTIHSYDAEGRVLSAVRQGTDSSQITLSRAQYDVAGRRTASFAPQTGITTYSESVGGNGRLVTTVYTNGATLVETNALDGSLLGRAGTAVHGVRYDYGVEAEGGMQRAYSKQIKRDGSSDTSEWTKTYADMLGRSYKTLYPDNAFSQSWYNNLGQLSKQADPDGVVILYAYNGKGEREYTAVDLDRNNQIDYGGADRITRTVSDVVADHGYTVRRTQTFVWPTNSANTPLLASVAETAVNGLYTWSTNYGLARQNHTVMGGSGYVTATNIAPDGSYSVTLQYNARVLGTTNYDANNGPLGSTVNGYDSHRRLTQATDGRNGTTTYAFNDADQVTSVTTPSPGGGQSGLVTSTAYDLMGQAWRITQPDNTYITNRFDLLGQITKSRTAPIARQPSGAKK